MNGLDSEAVIGDLYGPEKVLYALALGIDAVREGNRIIYSKPGKVVFGEADNRVLTERVQCIQNLWDRAGIAYETPVDMIRALWWKFMVNVGVNQISAILRAPYGVFHSSPEAQTLMESAMREVIAVAQVARVNLDEQDIKDWYPVLLTLSPHGKPRCCKILRPNVNRGRDICR
jgi:2-dehydropantoate 2-reductase